MIEFKLYTEYRPNLTELVSRYVDNFTLLKGTGSWKGIEEPCAVIVSYVEENSPEEKRLLVCVQTIKRVNNQEAVLVVRTHVFATLYAGDTAKSL